MTWTEQVDARIKAVRSLMEEAREMAREAGSDADVISWPYLDLIESMEREEREDAQQLDAQCTNSTR